MDLLGRTAVKGFRLCLFRNRPVQEFYGRLQAVMKVIDSIGSLECLFARPLFPGGNLNQASEIEWGTDLPGEARRYLDLPPQEQQRIGTQLMTSLEKIRAYAQARLGKSEIERDYAHYLQAVAVPPDLNQVMVVSDKPVILHWGLISETDQHPGQHMFAGWEEFIGQIQRKAPPMAAPTPTPKPAEVSVPTPMPVAPPAPSLVEEKKSVEEKKQIEAKKPVQPPKPAKQSEPPKERQTVPFGLGEYQWVKWLAILLAIIILVLLLLRLLPPRHPLGVMMPPSGMSAGGGMPGAMPGGMPGGMPSETSVGVSGGGPPNFLRGTCPNCGTYFGDGSGGPLGATPSNNWQSSSGGQSQTGIGPSSAAGVQQPGGSHSRTGSLDRTSVWTLGVGSVSTDDRFGASIPSSQGVPRASTPGTPAGRKSSQPGEAAGVSTAVLAISGLGPQHQSSQEEQSGQQGIKAPDISFAETGDLDRFLISRPPDPGTSWMIVDANGRPFPTHEAFLQKNLVRFRQRAIA